MAVTIKRRTGMIGMGSKIDLKVDGQLVTKLKNNEVYQVDAKSKEMKVKVNQWFFGSPEKSVTDGQTIEVKTNMMAILLFFVSFIFLFAGSFTSQPILLVLALALIVCTIVFGGKGWFSIVQESQG
ncbi:hypothetical protein [Alkalihalobacillus trypoxylicola]|uniref:Uncharacterized protein n=1 Tax=Alkalihalobacillus trypoxylicola TaxID=519424 RepID=A0A161P6N2_9BACI|nr:hypothetical protein [Alkalihalobacillus trypoxylicola]KYG26026.1 hypothetical protein AZF04_13140 [Alkalihalobacillus trypoxylicola]